VHAATPVSLQSEEVMNFGSYETDLDVAGSVSAVVEASDAITSSIPSDDVSAALMCQLFQ